MKKIVYSLILIIITFALVFPQQTKIGGKATLGGKSNAGVAGTGGGGSSLLTGLKASWKFDESSGNAADSSGNGYTLTNNNTATYNTGKLNNALYLASASSQYLSITNTADLKFGDEDFTFSCWFYSDSSGAYTIAAQDGSSTRGPLLQYRVGSGEVQFTVWKATNTQITAHGPNLTANTWYFIVAWHDATADTVNIQVNNGTVNSTATGGALQTSSTEGFWVGRDQFTDDYCNCRIDSLSVHKRVLTTGEKTTLYNSGTGLQYPF